jgi:RimJ/RimL family protein N-acetyltransferase
VSYRIIGNDTAKAMAWAADKWPETDDGHDWGPFTTLHMENAVGITAVVVYNSYIPKNSIDIHVCAAVAGRWLTRPFLAAVFRYPFEQLGVRRVTARIGANNPKAKKFLESLGFTHEGTIRKGWEPNIDLLVYGLLKEECRFLEPRYNGQTVSTRRARSGRNGKCTDAEQYSDSEQ